MTNETKDPKKGPPTANAPKEEEKKSAAPKAETPKKPEPPKTPEEKLAAAEKELKEKDNKYMYLYAEFENFKKRTQKEYGEAIRFGAEPLAHDLLPVLDNLERALMFTGKDTDKGLIDGLKMVVTQFLQALAQRGIQPVESIGKKFDPHMHEAVGQESSKEKPEGVILREELRGYTLHGRLLRASKVVVSSGPEGAKK